MVVVFSCQVVPNSLQPHGLQHNRLPCSSPSSGVSPSSCPLNQWCHPIISSSVIPFSFCPQFFTASGSLPTSQLFTSGGQSIGASATFLRCHCLPLPFPACPHPIYLDSWTTHSRFLCNTFLYSIGFYFHHQTHIHNWVLFQLWPSHFILSGAISSCPLLFPSSILDTFWPRRLIFWCHNFLPCHTGHGVLIASKLEWFAIISFSEVLP